MSESTPVDHEVKLTLVEAARLVPGRPHSSALWRWSRRGVRAANGEIVKLKCWQFGRKLFTSSVALDDFAAHLAQANAENFDNQCGSGRNVRRCKHTRTSKQRNKAASAAMAELDAMGV